MRYGVLALAVVAALAALPAAGAPAPRRSTLSPGTDDGAPRWSPGGRMLLLDTSWESKNYGTFYNLAVADPGGRSRVIGRHDSGEFEEWDREGVWSPSGSLVAFTRTVGLGDADHIYVSGIGGAGQRRLSRPGTDVHETSPTWSPDGREIAFLSGEAISAVRPDGSDRRVILSGDASEPRWSPDGRLIAFLRKSPRSDARRVFVVRPDGAGLRQVAGDGSYALGGWSPDSSRLLVVAGVRNGDYRMRVLRADGSGVADLGRGAAPDWSPDGARIVFWRTDGLYVVPSVGGAPRRVYRFPAPQGVNEPPSTAPDWSPDGRRIAFAVQRDCISRGAYVLELATGKVQRASNDCHIVGTARRDALRGTNERDIVRGLAGNDVLDGNPGDRPNPHHGRYDRDLLDGGPGSDVLLGRRNADVLLGGPGNDRLLGGRGVDRLLGGAGSDAFFARDGWRDTIRCGPGFDTVVADRVDLVARDCERVTRAAA